MRYSEYFVQVALLAQNGDKETAEKLLREAEKRAVVPQDYADLANWRKKYLNDEKNLQKNDEDNLV